MPRARCLALCAPALAVLAACAPGSSIVDAAEVAANVADVIADIGVTPSTQPTMPTSGTAQYNGYATAMITETLATQTGTQFVGALVLEAEFTDSGGTVTGTIGDMLAKDEVNQTELFQAILAGDRDALETLLDGYDQTSGQVTLRNGVITGGNFAGDLAGTLTHEGSDFTFGGTATGSFSGDTAGSTQITGVTNSGMTITQDGTDRSGRLSGLAVR